MDVVSGTAAVASFVGELFMLKALLVYDPSLPRSACNPGTDVRLRGSMHASKAKVSRRRGAPNTAGYAQSPRSLSDKHIGHVSAGGRAVREQQRTLSCFSRAHAASHHMYLPAQHLTLCGKHSLTSQVLTAALAVVISAKLENLHVRCMCPTALLFACL